MYLAPSLLVVAAVLTLVFLPTVRAAAPELAEPTSIAAAASFPVLLFASVLIHELAHGLVAGACGVGVRQYVLTFWGGHTSFTSDLRTPGVAALVSGAGPAANLLLAGAGWLLLEVLPPGLVAVIVAALVWSNGVVAVFNLLPGNPLDGGRILEAAIWKATGSRDIGAIGSGWVGRVIGVGIAVVMIGLPLLRGQQPDLATAAWAVLVGALVFSGGSRSIALGRARQQAAGFDARSLLRPAAVLPTIATVAQIPPVPFGVTAQDIVVLDGAGQVVAIADRAALAQVPLEARATTPITAVARAVPAEAVLTAVVGADAVRQLARGIGAGSDLVAVSPHGVLGVIRREEALAAFAPRPSAPGPR